MKILVLGGTKFFGKEFVCAMAQAGHDVTVFSRRAAVLPPSVKFILGDRADLSPLAGKKWDFVLDNICYTPEEMLEAIKVLTGRAKHYVFVSTGDVHLAVDGARSPFDEDIAHALPPRRGGVDAYGKGKYDAERILRASPLPYTIVRFPIVIGPGDPKDRLNKYITPIKESHAVILPDGGIYKRRFIYIKDCARALELVMQNREKCLGQILQFGNREITLKEFISLCFELTGMAEKTKSVPFAELSAQGYDLAKDNPYFNPFDYVLDVKKAERLLDWKPAPMEQWLKTCIDFELQRKNRQ